MENTTLKQVLKKAVAHWGRDCQMSMLQEECAELIAAVSHFNRGRITQDELMGEIADVEIMCMQIARDFR